MRPAAIGTDSAGGPFACGDQLLLIVPVAELLTAAEVRGMAVGNGPRSDAIGPFKCRVTNRVARYARLEVRVERTPILCVLVTFLAVGFVMCSGPVPRMSP